MKMHSIPIFKFVFGVLILLPNHILPESSYGGATKKSGERELSVAVNPGCTRLDCSGGNGSLIHVRSDSSTDSLHFIWNFFGSPTLLLARTELTSKLRIDWDGLFLGRVSSLSFDPPEMYSFGTSLVTIWTFNDTLDQVAMNEVDQNYVFAHNTSDFVWQTVQEQFVNRSDLIQFSHIAREYNNTSLGPNGYINITVKIRNTDGYSDILPYMHHNGNSSQVDISFNQIQFDDGTLGATSRIGVGYIFVQQFPQLFLNSTADWGMKIHRTKELDDEHTPGVFEMFSLRTRTVHYDQSYLEWKPIAYTANVRDIADSVDVHVYPMEDNSTSATEILPHTPLWSFYGSNTSNLLVQKSSITFGTQGDGFYSKTSHISWTYMTGMESNEPTLEIPIELEDKDDQILSSPMPPPLQDSTSSEPEETTAEDEDNKTVDASKTAEIPSFSEWTKLQLSKKQETLLQVQSNGFVKEKEGKKEDGKNFASPDCGAKILMANPEAQNPHGILSSSHDEYMLNRCGVSSWFIIELCDSIKLEKISIGNLELFSSSPKDIEVGVSDRYPTRDWTKLAPLELPDARAIHSFPVMNNVTFSKFIRIQILSHHGHEHYCPVSVVRFYGKSEFEVIDTEPSDGDMGSSDDRSSLSEENIDATVGDAASKESMIKIAADTLVNMVKNAAQVLVKRGSTDDADGQHTCQSTTNCLASAQQQQINVTEICNWELLYFVHANSHYFSKNSSCKAILNSYCLGSPSQIEGFWRALFGDGILHMVCSYTTPLQTCSDDATLYPSSTVEEIGINNGLNGNLTQKTKTNATPTQNGGNGIGSQQQPVTHQEPIENSSNNVQQPIPPVFSESVITEKAPVIEEESRTQNKESVFVRLTNRIKALERNQSLSSGYLEELSQRFKKQSEESYIISQNLKKNLNETASKYKWIQEFSRRESNYLRRSVADLRVSLWKTDMQRGFLVFVAMVQFIGMLFFCCWTRRRISSLEDKLEKSLRSETTSTTTSSTFDHSGRVRLVSESQQHPIVPRKRSNSHPDVMKPKKKKKKKELLKQSASNVFHFVPPSNGGGEGARENRPPTPQDSSLAASGKLSTSGSVLLTSGQILPNQASNVSTSLYSSNFKTNILEGHSDPSSINRFGILASPSVNTLNSVSSVSSTTSTETPHRKVDSSSSTKSNKGKKLKLKNFMPKLFDK